MVRLFIVFPQLLTEDSVEVLQKNRLEVILQKYSWLKTQKLRKRLIPIIWTLYVQNKLSKW